MNHCINCRYFSQSIADPRMLCKHPEAIIGSDPVTGAVGYFTCVEMREHYKCGKEGVFFEYTKRNTFFAMLKNAFLS